MIETFKKDTRVIKTQKSFQNAMELLLKCRKFKQLTINDLCKKALASRATFYSHYRDKYDLLESWLCAHIVKLKNMGIENISENIFDNKIKIFQNILLEANAETIKIVHDSMRLLLSSYKKLNHETEYKILSGFYVGGLVEVIKWQGKQNNMQEFIPAQDYFINLTKTILEFHVKYAQEKGKQNKIF